MTTPQAVPPRANPTVADDVAYLLAKNQQQLAINEMITHAWNERMYGGVPDAPAILLTEAQHQDRARTLAANAKGQHHADEYGVPDPPAILFAKP